MLTAPTAPTPEDPVPAPVRRLQPGDPAPDLALPDADGRAFSLTSLRGRKVVVYFYPAASTPGCTRQACDFRDALTEFERADLEGADLVRAHAGAAGFAVVGVSPDPPAALAAFRDAHGLTFPLLSDPDRTTMTAWGAYGEKQLYGRTVTGVIRSTVVLDERGVVLQASYGVKATGHVARLRRQLAVS